MAIYSDYTTLTDVLAYLGTSASGQNALLLDLIRATSRDMEDLSGGRVFYPRNETRYFDQPADNQLDFDDDVLAVTTLTNGDATTIASTEYNLLPYNETPYYALRLKGSSTVTWQPDSSGNSERVLSAAVITGWHTRYAHAWPDTGAVLAAAIVSTSATSATCTTGIIHAGDLIKLDSEYLYVSAVAVAASDTLTLVRGVNGSTAATHLISAPLYRWHHPDIALICEEAVVARFRLKNNPVGESIQMGEYTFQTPKDVNAFMLKRLVGIGAVRSY